jgi:CrcB protein
MVVIMRADTTDVEPQQIPARQLAGARPHPRAALPSSVVQVVQAVVVRRLRLRLPAIRNVALVAAGGALGAVARAAVGALVAVPEGGWPWATLAANLSGALLLGLLLGVIGESFAGGRWARPLLGTGVIGSYTTFSTLSLEMVRLVSHGRIVVAGGYGVVTLAGGLVAVWAGSAAAARLLGMGRGGR